jgi:pyruvate dehydrogenase E2 component (dihydrolipoyllysine-residue acetyltransferase)
VANEVKLPRLGQGMEAGTVTRWLKAEGDEVAKGEPLYEIDTDKVTQEVESDFAGVLLRITLPEGEAPVGETIAWIGEAGEEIPAPVAQAAAVAPAEPRVPGTLVPGTGREPAVASSSNGGRVKASPLARRLARERGIDLAQVRGTGPDGRIVAEDVEHGAAAAPAAAPAPAPVVAGEVESVPLTNVRRTIARRLTAAWQAPVFQLTVSADMTRANQLVAKARELDPEVRVTVTDVLAKVCAAALRRHRDVNVAFAEDALLRYPSANIGIAVAAPQGLVVPVIAGVESRTLADVARARGEIVERARANKLTAADLDGGTFTISNLGMYGIEQFVAVLNPPQAAILAVGATEDRPVAVDGELVVRPMMTMTLTVDHRAVDGAEGADFLRTVKRLLEEPALAL